MGNASVLMFKLSFLFLLFLSLNGCSKNPVSSGAGQVILPLAVGNQWVYHVRQFQHYGNTQIDRLDTTLVWRSTKEGVDSTYWIRNLEITLFWSPSFLNKSDGLYIIDHSGPVIAPVGGGGNSTPVEEQFVQFPTVPGDSIRFRYLTLRTLSVGSSTSAEGGIFDCVVYDAWSYDTTHAGTFWVAPGIGIVKSWQLVGADTLYTSLLSYRLNE